MAKIPENLIRFPLWAQELGLVIERQFIRLEKNETSDETVEVFGRRLHIESHLTPQPQVVISIADH